MCGIAGLAGLAPVNAAAVAEMTSRMTHRGPDDGGLWQTLDGRVALGHRRLSVIDVSEAGHQPMVSADGDLTIVFNGEIYNYRELAAELAEAGASFRSHSDTEVILEAWRRWGEDCLSRFNGMFAFALFDRRRNLLFCARDRFGEKPFLFSQGRDFFAFASEYKALLALDGVDAGYDRLRLARFLHQAGQALDDGTDSLFPAIRQLPPGHCMTVDLAALAVTMRRYWDVAPDPDLRRLTMADAAAQFRDLLTDAVKLRLRSDVPVGSCLSGGLDSSSIVCLARNLVGADRPYHVFTGRFPNTQADEWAYAVQVVEATGAVSHVTEPTGADFLADLPAFQWANELPVGSSSQYAQWRVFRLAREQGVTVLLDGQGADEVMGGYEQYFNPYLAELRQTVPEADYNAERDRILARYPLGVNSAGHKLKTVLPLALRHRLGRWSKRGSDVLFGLTPGLAQAVGAAWTPFPSDPRFGPLAAKLHQDSFHGFLPTLLRYGDRNSMAHAREVRLPFCDHRIADFVFSLPAGHLMGDAQTKRLLREAMRGILPQGVRERWNKQGFLPPQDVWFRDGGLAERAAAVIEDPGFGAEGLWHAPWWRSALRRYRAGAGHLAWVLWRPLIADAWLRHFHDPVRAMKRQPIFAAGS